MGRFKNLEGQRFGSLLVIEKTDRKNKNGNYYWKCLCDCGNELIVIGASLTNGNTENCGKCPKNTFINKGDYYIGLTAKGEPFYFDIEDYDLIKQYNWHITDKGRIQANTPNGPIRMHRLIMGFPENEVDHQDGKQNNNRRYNLRICTHANNMRNMKKHIDGNSKYKGVSWANHCRKWRAQIFVNGKRIHLGYFGSEKLAHEEYCKASLKYHGEFGRTG